MALAEGTIRLLVHYADVPANGQKNPGRSFSKEPLGIPGTAGMMNHLDRVERRTEGALPDDDGEELTLKVGASRFARAKTTTSPFSFDARSAPRLLSRRRDPVRRGRKAGKGGNEPANSEDIAPRRPSTRTPKTGGRQPSSRWQFSRRARNVANVRRVRSRTSRAVFRSPKGGGEPQRHRAALRRNTSLRR